MEKVVVVVVVMEPWLLLPALQRTPTFLPRCSLPHALWPPSLPRQKGRQQLLLPLLLLLPLPPRTARRLPWMH